MLRSTFTTSLFARSRSLDGANRQRVLALCYSWWAQVWAEVLSADAFRRGDAGIRMRIARIEDFVLPDPDDYPDDYPDEASVVRHAAGGGPSARLAACLAASVGILQPSPSAMRAQLRVMHSFKASYMGRRFGAPPRGWRLRAELKSTLAIHAAYDPNVASVLRLLGYNDSQYALATPEEPRVMTPAAFHLVSEGNGCDVHRCDQVRDSLWPAG